MDGKGKHLSKAAIASLSVLIIVTFFTSLYMKGLNSGIPLYYDSIGYSATVGGALVATFTLASMAMRLFGGQITDSFSHIKVLVASLAGLLLGVLIPLMSDEFYIVMASRVVQGASFALATNVMTVAVMGSASTKHLGRRVGIKGASTSLGTMVGALVATWLLDGVGYHGFYAFYAALMAVALAAVFILGWKEKAWPKKGAKRAEEGSPSTDRDLGTASGSKAKLEPGLESTATAGAPSEGAEKGKALARAKRLVAPYLMPQVFPYLAISFARRMPRGFCIAFVLIYAKYAGIGTGAVFFVAAGATAFLCRLFGGKLFDSGKAWLLWPLVSFEIIGFALLAAWPSMATLVVSAVCYGVSVGTSSSFVKTLTAQATPKKHWGVVNGELYFFGDLGKALGAFLGGVLIDATSKLLVPEIALGFAVFASAVTALALLLGRRFTKHRQAVN